MRIFWIILICLALGVGLGVWIAGEKGFRQVGDEAEAPAAVAPPPADEEPSDIDPPQVAPGG